jgi:hypothetical protein
LLHGKDARHVTALLHGQLAVQIGEAAGSLVSWLRVSSASGFAKESHGTGTEPPQGFKTDCAKRKSRTAVVGEVVSELVAIPKSSGMARGAGGGINAGSWQEMDEREVRKSVAWPGAQVAVKAPAYMGTVGSEVRKLGVSPFAARGEAQAAHKFAQNFRRLVMAAWH